MKKFLLLILVSTFTISVFGQESKLKLVEVRKIWDEAPHNAFTDLIRFDDRWFCTFRESTGHVKGKGALRIISSTDGKNWNSEALVESADTDLRDPKLSITPDGKLLLNAAEAVKDNPDFTHKSLAWISGSGKKWGKKHEIGDPNFWLWRTTWNNNSAYNFGYACGDKKSLRLYKSSTGKKYDILVKDLNITSYPNETAMLFRKDTAYCLLRRGGDQNTGMIGISTAPYTKWNWKDLGIRIGGPEMLLLPDGRFLATVRLYDSEGWHPARTSVCWVDPEKGTINEALKLPSGGDTSYAGMVYFNGIVWISYYSSHEDKSAIYLAKVKIDDSQCINSVEKRFENSANQGVAVDKDHYYAISNTSIHKHHKVSNEKLASWSADISNASYSHFTHMNSGTVVGDELYVAHSRYKVDPNDNTVEVWDLKNDQLKHIRTIPMPAKYGSLTWIDHCEDGFWWMCYAVYGKTRNKKTRLVKYSLSEGIFTELNKWYFPGEVVSNWGKMSCSGGSWGPDGKLYTTGHDHEKAFVLTINSANKLEHVKTESGMGFYGQAIAWDRTGNHNLLWGIVKRKFVVATRLCDH